MKYYRFPKFLKILLMVATAVFFFGLVTMHLWNWLIPTIFDLTPITFTQALGLVILSKILFGGIHRHGGRGRGWRRHMESRFANMTPEERERFRSGMRGRNAWCRPTPPPEPTL